MIGRRSEGVHRGYLSPAFDIRVWSGRGLMTGLVRALGIYCFEGISFDDNDYLEFQGPRKSICHECRNGDLLHSGVHPPVSRNTEHGIIKGPFPSWSTRKHQEAIDPVDSVLAPMYDPF